MLLSFSKNCELVWDIGAWRKLHNTPPAHIYLSHISIYVCPKYISHISVSSIDPLIKILFTFQFLLHYSLSYKQDNNNKKIKYGSHPLTYPTPLLFRSGTLIFSRAISDLLPLVLFSHLFTPLKSQIKDLETQVHLP